MKNVTITSGYASVVKIVQKKSVSVGDVQLVKKFSQVVTAALSVKQLHVGVVIAVRKLQTIALAVKLVNKQLVSVVDTVRNSGVSATCPS